MRINIYAHLIIIEILDEIYARAKNWSSVEYSSCTKFSTRYVQHQNKYKYSRVLNLSIERCTEFSTKFSIKAVNSST